MRTGLFFICLLIWTDAHAQLHDANWFLGVNSISPNLGIAHLSFETGQVQVSPSYEYYIGFDDDNTVFSDSSGQYLAMFQGFAVVNKNYQKMKNGDSLWYSPLEWNNDILNYSDDDIPQGSVFLPWPGSKDSLILIYAGQGMVTSPHGTPTLGCRYLQYAVIDLSKNDGLGEVIQRRNVILQDSIQIGKLVPIKHANGRDWWLFVFEFDKSTYYRISIDSSGLHLIDSQMIDNDYLDGLGQSCFSPDGTTYAMINAIDPSIGDFLDLFDVDRCSGLLYNQRKFHYPGSYGIGCAFSPSSRYLYVNFNTSLYQYDLQSPNPDSSKILLAEVVPPPPGENTWGNYYQMQLAPDGKIYICGTSYFRYLHVIHRPDEPGAACQFEPYGLALPARNSASVTFSPNYRLGPLDGSACDTLGLNNLPRAWFRHEQDTLSPLAVQFRDLSYYEPTSWSWDFGDGSPGSAQREPVHVYDWPGVYPVCLTVTNANGTHTFCRTLYLGVSAVANPAWEQAVQVWPNPFTTYLMVSLPARARAAQVRLYDAMGRLAGAHALETGVTEVSVGDLPPGLYFYEVVVDGARVKAGKVRRVWNE